MNFGRILARGLRCDGRLVNCEKRDTEISPLQNHPTLHDWSMLGNIDIAISHKLRLETLATIHIQSVIVQSFILQKIQLCEI